MKETKYNKEKNVIEMYKDNKLIFTFRLNDSNKIVSVKDHQTGEYKRDKKSLDSLNQKIDVKKIIGEIKLDSVDITKATIELSNWLEKNLNKLEDFNFNHTGTFYNLYLKEVKEPLKVALFNKVIRDNGYDTFRTTRFIEGKFKQTTFWKKGDGQ